MASANGTSTNGQKHGGGWSMQTVWAMADVRIRYPTLSVLLGQQALRMAVLSVFGLALLFEHGFRYFWTVVLATIGCRLLHAEFRGRSPLEDSLPLRRHLLQAPPFSRMTRTQRARAVRASGAPSIDVVAAAAACLPLVLLGNPWGISNESWWLHSVLLALVLLVAAGRIASGALYPAQVMYSLVLAGLIAVMCHGAADFLIGAIRSSQVAGLPKSVLRNPKTKGRVHRQVTDIVSHANFVATALVGLGTLAVLALRAENNDSSVASVERDDFMRVFGDIFRGTGDNVMADDSEADEDELAGFYDDEKDEDEDEADSEDAGEMNGDREEIDRIVTGAGRLPMDSSAEAALNTSSMGDSSDGGSWNASSSDADVDGVGRDSNQLLPSRAVRYARARQRRKKDSLFRMMRGMERRSMLARQEFGPRAHSASDSDASDRSVAARHLGQTI